MNLNIHAATFLAATFAHSWEAGALLTVTFAGAARALRGVTNAGAIAGGLICFVLYLGGGLGTFATLIVVFALAWICTRIGYQRKSQRGIAEKREGRRASQVLANLSVAALCGLVYGLHGGSVWLLASAAALSEAAADTVASEIGQATSATARLITNWEPVSAGTDGAISPLGSSAGFAAAVAVSATAVLAGLIPPAWIGVPVFAAMVGMLGDSFLGAVLERKHFLNNDGVNFLGTLIAAAIAMMSHAFLA